MIFAKADMPASKMIKDVQRVIVDKRLLCMQILSLKSVDLAAPQPCPKKPPRKTLIAQRTLNWS